MHKYQPGQTVTVWGIDLTFHVGAETGEIADELWALLTESGVADPDSKILDWEFCPPGWVAPGPTWPEYVATLVNLQIAFPAGVGADEVAAELSTRLTEDGVQNFDSNILNWRVRPTPEGGSDIVTVTLSNDPEEGEAFALLDALLQN